MTWLRAFSTLGCPAATLDEALSLAQEFGLGGIEIRALGGTVDVPHYLAQQFGTPEALAEKLRDAAIRIVSFDTSLHLAGGAAGEREQLLAFIPWAEALGVPRLRVFDGGKTGDDAEIAEAAETVAWWRKLRGERGWKVDWMVETHDSLFTSSAIQRFLQQAPGVGILWDTHHTWKRGGEDPVATWRAIHRDVVHVHVKDSISVPSARHPFTYVLPGQGEFPAGPMLDVLRKELGSRTISLEWELMWHPYLPPLSAALTAMAAQGWW